MYHISSNKKLNLYKTIQIAEVQNLQKQHSANHEQLFWAYHSLFFTDIPLPKNSTDEIFWKKLTKPQQVIYSLGIFIGQTNNGGIWQFFFNHPAYICAVGEAFETFSNMNLFNTHYTRCFNDFAEILNNGIFEDICEKWNDTSLTFEERWAAFKSGEQYISHHSDFESYFYSEEGKNRLYKGLLNPYIEQNLGAMLLIETGSVQKMIDKKEAIPHFTTYLTQYYGIEPSEVSIYYSANVTINYTATKLFLMRFTLPNGYEGLGITGYFTHHFAHINWADIQAMHQRNHKQELINIYYGWYLIAQYKQNNANLSTFNQADWLSCLQKLQAANRTQIPVNVQFKEALFYDNQWYYAFTGDFYYNDNSEIFPSDLSNVPMLSVSDKQKGEYRGELTCLFTAIHTENPHCGRRHNAPNIDTKCLFERWIGRQHKLLKDNPWGF